MFVFGNFLMGIAEILDIALNIYMWLIIISALLSWVNPDPYNPIVRFLHQATDPLLRRVRRALPFSSVGAGLDFSPIIVLLAIVFLRQALVRTLFQIAARMGGG